MYDIAIVGLGPAGATLARLLGEHGGFSVCAVDQKALDGSQPSFQKPCGGLLAPDAQKALSRFGLSLPREILATPQIFAVRTLDLFSAQQRHYQRFYLNMDRHAFDLWLCSLIAPSVHIYSCARVAAVRRAPAGFELTVRRKGETQTVCARQVVGADGANSLLRKFLGAPPIRQYVAIQQWFLSDAQNPLYWAIFDARLTDCYAWSDCKNGHQILGAALPKQNCKARFEALKERLTPYGFDFSRPVKTEGCLVCRPSSAREIFLGTGDVFLIGEAAGFVSPSSLEGISGAMESARLLYESLLAAHPADTYRKKSRPLRLKMAAKLLKCPFLYQPHLRRLVLKSGLSSID